jgi:malate dehydrogenase
MSREELLNKNAEIIKSVSLNIKELAPHSLVIVVTNPLDLMTYMVLKTTGFDHKKVLGMGISLDAARFANLISEELNISPADVEACVIGSHGSGMLPLPRFTRIKGAGLDKMLDEKQIEELVKRTVNRGAEIVSLLGSGSAYFAPSASIASLVKSIIKDEKRTLGVCTYLTGEYGLQDVCIGVPCRVGKNGIEGIVQLELSSKETETLVTSADNLKKQYSKLTFD